MRNGRTRGGLAATLASGMKDIPRNASWVVGKALSTHDGSDGADETGPTLGDAVRQAGWSLRGALPGQDSVEARLEKARVAAERARSAEESALEAAQVAHDRSVAADDLAETERTRLEDVESAEADKVDQRTDEARRRAEEMIAEERRKAEAEAAATLEDERRAGEERVAQARRSAESAQQDAEDRFKRATDLLAEARSLADEAAEAASEAAEQARRQAEQVADDARRGAEEATHAVTRAEELRASTATTAKTVVRGVSAKENPQRLKDLNKAELLKLAAAQGIEGRTSKTKQQLVTALNGAARRS
jgi:colicin import membrane protein